MARVIVESRVRAIRRRRRIVAVAVVLAVLVVIFGGIVWLSRAPFLRVTAIEVSGAQTLSTSSITVYAQQEMAGSYFYLFARNNIFLYPKAAIVGGLVAGMPTIASAQVHAADFHTIDIDITERQPKALWCGEAVASSTDGATVPPCLLLDQNGTAYAPALTNAGYEKYYGAFEGTSTGDAVPQQYLAQGQFSALSALVDALAAQNATDTVESIYVDQNSDVYVAYQSGFQLIFSLADAGGDVYQRFELALQADPFKGKELGDFQYLDLRFGDKLYYKLKQ